MSGGDYLSNLKEWLSKLNLRITTFLTPVAYTEYAIKMLLILKPKRLLKLFQIDVAIHVICILMSIIFKPHLVSIKTVFLSALISVLLLSLFIIYRTVLQKRVLKLSTQGDITYDEVHLKDIPIPDSLALVLHRYQNKDDNNNNKKESE